MARDLVLELAARKMQASGKNARGGRLDFVAPIYTPDEIDRAGCALIAEGTSSEDLYWAYNVFGNWRASFNYPLNSIAVVLKGRAARYVSEPVVAQRLKRIESVENKLRKRGDITLSTMQDVGGCRAVMDSVANVYALRNLYVGGGRRLTHDFKQENDYIRSPKKDGYRGIHLIYYFGGRAERAKVFAERRMQIEIQLRTQLQHYWATAVETAETFSRQALKSQRDENTTPWRRFFALVSSGFAYEENCPLVPKMSKDIGEVISQLRLLEDEHHFCDSLDAYKLSAERINSRNKAKYFLVELDLDSKEVKLTGFRPDEGAEGATAYTTTEQQSLLARNMQSVLVSAGDVSDLKRAYPNYFLDTTEFVARVRGFIIHGREMLEASR